MAFVTDIGLRRQGKVFYVCGANIERGLLLYCKHY